MVGERREDGGGGEEMVGGGSKQDGKWIKVKERSFMSKVKSMGRECNDWKD